MLREEAARGTPEGQEVDEIMREGKLVPAVSGCLPCTRMIHIIVRVEWDSRSYERFILYNSQRVTVRLLKEAMLSSPGSEGFLIDGFPRELPQGKIFIDQVQIPTQCFHCTCIESTHS